MNLISTEKTPNHTVIKESSLTNLNTACDELQDNKISGLEAIGAAISVWDDINDNPKLKTKLDEKLEQRRQVLRESFGQLNISESGDPVKKRYNPNHWIGTLGENEKDQEGKIVDKMKSLHVFLETL